MGFEIDLEERRTVFLLIARLPTERRIEWLVWCCGQVSRPNHQVIVTKTSGTTTDIYLDWLALCHSHGLNFQKSRAELHRLVRLFGKPLSWSASLWPLQRSSAAGTVRPTLRPAARPRI